MTNQDGAPALFSVGYEGRSQDELVAQLREHGVTVLLDVRLRAISRKPGFSWTRLAQSLDEAGIAYRHASALGNPADNHTPFRSGDLEEGLRVYRDLISSERARGAPAPGRPALDGTGRGALLRARRASVPPAGRGGCRVHWRAGVPAQLTSGQCCNEDRPCPLSLSTSP